MVKINDINVPIKYVLRNVDKGFDKNGNTLFSFDVYINGKKLRHGLSDASSIEILKIDLIESLRYQMTRK